jgi:excisionase family DNA binding protein
MSQILGTTDAALRLGCSPEWVRRLADEGRLPVERTINGTRIFRSDDVEALARQRAAMKARAGGGEE